MGREANSELEWGSESASCKVLLESDELIVRGAIKRRVPLASLSDVEAQGNKLTFRVGLENVVLQLQPGVAVRWARAIATPPPTLAKKLGISSQSQLRLVGSAEDPELQRALATAATVHSSKPDLIVAVVNTPDELDGALLKIAGSPIWIVYPKGSGRSLSESSVRQTLHAHGYQDTKVASVSSTLTALRFNPKTTLPRPVKQLDTRNLRDLAGIGPSIEGNLRFLGVTSVAQLSGANGSELYQQLCAKTGTRHDPCVLDVFRCAVAQARDPRLQAERCNWWWWSRERKAGRLPESDSSICA